MVTRLSPLPVCTAATATIVNGASRLHNSVSVVKWLIHLRAACEQSMLVEHNHTQNGGRGCGGGGAGRPWATQTWSHHSYRIALKFRGSKFRELRFQRKFRHMLICAPTYVRGQYSNVRARRLAWWLCLCTSTVRMDSSRGAGPHGEVPATAEAASSRCSMWRFYREFAKCFQWNVLDEQFAKI